MTKPEAVSVSPVAAAAVPVVVPVEVEEPVSPPAPTYAKLQTVGFDARFPNQNQVLLTLTL